MRTDVYKSAEAFKTFLDTLREAAETYLGAERGLVKER